MLYLSVLSNTLNMEPRIPGKEGTNRKKKRTIVSELFVTDLNPK
jgi:hypothetical protein